MREIAVALVQETPPRTEEEAVTLGARACEAAAHLGADIVLFPELWQIGYRDAPSDPEGRAAWQAQATNEHGEFVGHFRALARRLEIAIVVTYLERWPGAPRNAAALFDRRGDVVLIYAKVHTVDFTMEAATTPGDMFGVAPLDTGSGEIAVGLMICYDREFPEAGRALMLGGAELVLVPNACELPEPMIRQFRTRAIENMYAMAMANYAADPERPRSRQRFDGHSIAVSGIYADEEGRVVDDLLVQAGEAPGLFIARFDLDDLRAYRRRGEWGDTYRKPWAYGALVEDNCLPEFYREDSRRAAPARESPTRTGV